MAGGATGTFAAMGPSGPAVQDALARRLGLISMPVDSRSLADPFAELVAVLGLLSSTGSAIAEEISRLAGVEFGELAETLPAGDVASSTMPQKRNAKLCGEIVTIGAQLRSLVPLALEAVIQSHEVHGARTAMMDEALEQALILSGDALIRLHDVRRHGRDHREGVHRRDRLRPRDHIPPEPRSDPGAPGPCQSYRAQRGHRTRDPRTDTPRNHSAGPGRQPRTHGTDVTVIRATTPS